MRIEIDMRDVHEAVQNTEYFTDFCAACQKELSSLPFNSMCCIHELGHEIYCNKAGIAIEAYLGPRMSYNTFTRKLTIRPASVKPDIRNMIINPDSTLEEFMSAVAKGYAAGGVCTLILTHSPDARDDNDYPDFLKFCDWINLGSPETTFDHKGMWDQAQIDVAHDLRAMRVRQNIWEQVSDIRPKLFRFLPT
jgi:hypothetical protein